MAEKKSIFENPILSTKIKSANTKLFPEAIIGYFLGPTLAMLSNSILSSYLNKYLTDVLDMNTWASLFMTLLPVLSVIFVVAGNIIVGRLMERNKTKAGKARPLILLSIPLMILALVVLFVFTPYTDAKEANIVTAILVAVGYNLWYAVAYPFYYTSHSALVGLSTRSSKDRSLIATIANATQLAAIGICSMVLPFFLGLIFIDGDPVGSYNAWKIFVIALMVVSSIGALLEYYFTRERVTEESFNENAKQPEQKATPIGVQAKICLKDKYWVIMIVFFLMYQLGGMLKNVSQLYYCQSLFMDPATGTYTIAYGGALHGTLSTIGAIPTALGMVIAWPLANKIGKGKAILFGSVLAVAGGILGIFTDNYIVAVIAFVVKALGSAPAMYLSLALLADIMDHQEAMHGVRTDGLTMSIYGAIMVGMTGIATGILNAILSGVGYSATNVSSELIRGVLPWIFFGGETIGYAIIVLLFIFMKVEKFSKFDHKAIVVDQKAKAEAEGLEYEDPAVRLAREEEEANAAAEEARKVELKARCEKQGLNYEEELAKYEAAQKKAEEDAAAKKAEADAKAAAKKAEEEAKYNALSQAEKDAIQAKADAKAKKEAEEDAKTLAEFNELRKAHGRPVID